MRLIAAVFEALSEFRDGCTRAQLEEVTGLDRDQVLLGLKGLRRRGVLEVTGTERQRSHYCLKSGSPPPTELRGGVRHEPSGGAPRSSRSYRPPDPPFFHPGLCDMVAHVPYGPPSLTSYAVATMSAAPCLLAETWRKR